MLAADYRSLPTQARWVGTTRKPVSRRHGWLGVFAVAIVSFALMEAALLFRTWTQLSADALDTWWKRFLYEAGGSLAHPFARYETVAAARTTDVLQYSVLVAAEAYFVIAVVSVLAIILLRKPLNAIASAFSDAFAACGRYLARGG